MSYMSALCISVLASSPFCTGRSSPPLSGEFAPGWRVKVKAALALRAMLPLWWGTPQRADDFAFPFAIYPLQEIPRSLPAVGLGCLKKSLP